MYEPRLFIDADGVLADFIGHFKTCFKLLPPSEVDDPNPEFPVVDDDVMWAKIKEHGEFYLTMPMFDGAREFILQTETLGFDPIILTSSGKSMYFEVARQKRIQIREKLTKDHLILPTYGGRAKTLFMHAPGDILIDDFQKNCDMWTEAGGTAILHTSFEESLKLLKKIVSYIEEMKELSLLAKTS